VQFSKYHGLGNDYLVIEPGQLSLTDALGLAPRLCHRSYGVGSDGILIGPLPSQVADFGLRIVNPDGSEAEKSGNGLRIFARYLWDTHRVGTEAFEIETPGGVSRAEVTAESASIRMGMGRASFDSTRVRVAGPPREVVDVGLGLGEEGLGVTAVSVGNPHCVIVGATLSEAEARRLGPRVERDARFENRTNVQLLRVIDRTRIEIQIWERGAGYTLASGSSACAAACAARKLGLCDATIRVQMPGGVLLVEVDDAFDVTQTGPAVRVAHGEIAGESLRDESPWEPLG
jgi:diaminopimelate epimerase